MLSDTVSRGGCRNEYRCECGSVWLVSTLSPRVIYEWGPRGLGEMADSRLQTGKVQGASEVSSRAKKQLWCLQNDGRMSIKRTRQAASRGSHGARPAAVGTLQ